MSPKAPSRRHAGVPRSEHRGAKRTASERRGTPKMSPLATLRLPHWSSGWVMVTEPLVLKTASPLRSAWRTANPTAFIAASTV